MPSGDMVPPVTGGVDADRIATALADHGLILRGGFAFGVDDTPPPARSGGPATAILLIGQSGASPWPHFLRWRERQSARHENPLDTWCREIIGDVADRFGARAVSPSDRPFLPFQQWAMRAEGLRPSPLGILMHPEYGLWHAYRGALLFDDIVSMPVPLATAHLCDSCADKPCLNACPVNAHSHVAFDYRACLAYAGGPDGTPCRKGGCLDRNACPYGTDYRYPRDVQAFHMASFLRPSG